MHVHVQVFSVQKRDSDEDIIMSGRTLVHLQCLLFCFVCCCFSAKKTKEKEKEKKTEKRRRKKAVLEILDTVSVLERIHLQCCFAQNELFLRY